MSYLRDKRESVVTKACSKVDLRSHISLVRLIRAVAAKTLVSGLVSYFVDQDEKFDDK